MYYWTDGSFEGILTAIFESYERKELPEAIGMGDAFQLPLAAECREVSTRQDKSDRVYDKLNRVLGQEGMETLYRCWLSGDADCGTHIHHAVRVAIDRGMARQTLNYLQDDHIRRLVELSRKVMGEAHMFLGILRFTKLNCGVFHAVFEPDFNVLPLVVPHFVERLSDQPWMILDARRNQCALYDTRGVVFSDDPPQLTEALRESDTEFETLWKRYFSAIAIESRYNPKLQRSFLPHRHWKHMTELQDRPR